MTRRQKLLIGLTAAGFAAAVAGAATVAGCVVAAPETAAAPPAPLARIAAMMSLVEPGFAAGAAGFGATGVSVAGTDAAAAGMDVATASGAGATSGVETSTAGVNVPSAAAAFCARIFAKISAVEGFFSSISIHFPHGMPAGQRCRHSLPALSTDGFWQHHCGLTTNAAESLQNFSEPRKGNHAVTMGFAVTQRVRWNRFTSLRDSQR